MLQSAWPFLLALQNQCLLSRLQKSELISVVFWGQKPRSETWESAVLSSALTQTLVVSLISITLTRIEQKQQDLLCCGFSLFVPLRVLVLLWSLLK